MCFWFCYIAVLALDIITKFLVVISITYGNSIPVWQDVFHLTYIVNYGAAFGVLSGGKWVFVFLALGVLLVMAVNHDKIAKQSWSIRCGVACLAAGASGNLLDRIFAGGVIDFLDFRIWPVFNIADIGICAGVALLTWEIVRTEQGKK